MDISPFSIYVLQPYWNYMIRFVPLNIAPNLITLIGFFGLTLNYLLVAYYIPLMEGPAPRWVYLTSAFAIEWYSLLDNLDGRQARRTRTSSPLGELFDHGCDCLAVAVGACTASSVFQFGPDYSVVVLITMSAAFWLATWEEYHTNTFFLGFINGPTEGLKIILAAYLWTFYAGPEFWWNDWRSVLPFPASWLAYLPYLQNREICVYLFSIAPMLITFYYNIQSVRTYKRKEGLAFGPAAMHLLPFFIFFGLMLGWYFNSHSLWAGHPHTLQIAAGFAFGEMASRLILAHLCKMPYAILQRPMLPLALALINSLSAHFLPSGALVDERIIMWAYLAVSLVGWMHYAYVIIGEVTAFLGIKCLSIPPQKHA